MAALSDEVDLLVRHLRRIEVEYGRQGWHGMIAPDPAVYLLYTSRPLELPLPPGQWTNGVSPGVVLLDIARELPEIPLLGEVLSRTTWYGVAIVFEAWLVASKGPADPELERMHRQRQLHLRPDRQTGRMAAGVTRHQHRARVARLEARPAEINTWTTEDDGEERHRGVVLDGLVAMVAAIDGMLMGHESEGARP